MPRPLHTAVVSLALFASGLALAQAQTTPTQPGPSPSPGVTTQPRTQVEQPKWLSPQGEAIRVSKLIGSSVRNSAGETVGDINEVVIDKDGKVTAVVLGVGGILGIGERQVAVGLDSLQLSRGDGGAVVLTLNTTKDALKSAPEWKWSAEDSRNTKPMR